MSNVIKAITFIHTQYSYIDITTNHEWWSNQKIYSTEVSDAQVDQARLRKVTSPREYTIASTSNNTVRKKRLDVPNIDDQLLFICCDSLEMLGL